jgi:hypothetical protein
MASWLRRTPLVTVAAISVLAGCTTTDDEAPEPTTSVLGDLATIQPCGLISPGVFDEFGSAEFGEPESLDYCTVVVTPDSAGTVSLRRDVAEDVAEEVTITVGQLVRPSDVQYLPTDKLEDVADSIHTTRPDDRGDSCSQALVFAEEDLALTVRSRLPVTAEPTPTCDLVTAGMAKVVEVVLAGEVEHRSPAPNSLVPLDPCDLVDDETVTALPGFAEARRVDSPGRHQCRWRTPDALKATVTFGVAPPPRLPESLDGNSDPLAGRPSVTIPFTVSCTVETGHTPFDEVDGATGFVETVEVYADTPRGQGGLTDRSDETDQADDSCAGAVAIAGALWPRLPGA